MIAAEVALALGAAHRSGQWWRCVCPVHGSRTGRSATLALRDGARGVIVRCWAGCDPCDVLAELRRRGLAQGRAEHRSAPAKANPDRGDQAARRIALARRIWDAALEARGTPVAAYLAGRGSTIAPPSSLRWAPSLRHPDGITAPAMVARIDGPDGAMIGVHRTWLARSTDDIWRRRGPKMMLGSATGGAVRLAPATETLMVGEGIETTLAVMIATGLSGWTALSTSGLVALILPPAVREVIIAADHDTSGAGERAAYAAAARWLAEGRRVRITMPPEPGTDFADVLAGRSCARIVEALDVAA